MSARQRAHTGAPFFRGAARSIGTDSGRIEHDSFGSVAAVRLDRDLRQHEHLAAFDFMPAGAIDMTDPALHRSSNEVRYQRALVIAIDPEPGVGQARAEHRRVTLE